MTTGGDLSADVPSPTPVGTGRTAPHPGLAAALGSLAGGGRVLSTCDRAIDGGDFVALGIPGVGGSGGVFRADYARFSHVVRGPTERTRPTFEGIPEAASGPIRMDLLSLLGVEYLVACDPPNSQRWSLMSAHNGVGLYRSLVRDTSLSRPPSQADGTVKTMPITHSHVGVAVFLSVRNAASVRPVWIVPTITACATRAPGASQAAT
ncbi:MAG: hypothetical protein ACRD3G_19200 [Vicinamibacterales bacterium]